MIRRDGLVKILDFGIAKYMPSGNGHRALVETEVGEVIGTAAYMSPNRRVDWRLISALTSGV
jgi:serine/threonine protein kinase